MRRPFVEPGHRSARPGIRHRSRSNGPDRKGRDPRTLGSASQDPQRPLPARLASDDENNVKAGETEEENFYSGDDQGFVTQTDENALTANEDLDDNDDYRREVLDDDNDYSADDRENSRTTSALANNRSHAARQLPIEDRVIYSDQDDLSDEDDDVRTPRNQSRTNLSATPRARPRAYSRSKKLAPEEEDWALKQESKRRKGGVLGRLKRLGRKRSDQSEGADKVTEGYDADAILGRSFGAVRELRSRKSTISRDHPADRRSVASRSDYRRGVAATAVSSGTAYGTNRASTRGSLLGSSGRGTFDDDFDSELAASSRSPRPVLGRGDAPSTIASGDENVLAADQPASPITPPEVSDDPPRLPLPIALKDTENARSPQLIDPYAIAVTEETYPRRSKSMAESMQPSVLDASDAASVIQPSSPLIPASGPLSHNDAIVPSQRPSMQSIRDAEIDESTMSRSRKPSMDLRAAAGGALGGLAAMIGFDALTEDKKGLPSKQTDAEASGSSPVEASVQSKSIDQVPAADTNVTSAPVVATDTASGGFEEGATNGTALLPRRNKKKKSQASALSAIDTSSAAPINGEEVRSVGLSDPSELPYAMGDSPKSKKTAAAAALAVPAALSVGMGGLAAAAHDDAEDEVAGQRRSLDRSDEEEPTLMRKSSQSLRDEESLMAVPIGGALHDNAGAADGAVLVRDFVSEPALTDVPDDADDVAALGRPAEKSDYATFGYGVGTGAVVANVAGKRSRKQKMTKGSRIVERMPALDEDESVTHRRPVPAPEKGGYLLTPSIAPSVADPLDAGRRQRGYQKGDWLTKALSPQQTHYFLRELSFRELKWELDRAWLLTSFEKPVKPRRNARKDFSDIEDDSRINDFDESSDEDLLDMDEDEDEEAVFRRGPSQFGPIHSQTTIPDLPLLRFLFKNAFATFPLFVAPEGKLDQYIGGPPDKATLARNYFFTGILPLLRAIQSRSLSAWVDRHGEGDGTPFSAVSTTGALRNLLSKWASKYVAAVLRVGPADPYFDDEGALDKEAWPWPAPNLLPPEAFYAYRKPLDRIKYGGYEVDVVGIRAHSASERDYIIRLRRPNRPDEYVVRNDSDFEEFRRNITRDLSPFAFVRTLPRTRGRPDEGESDIEDDSPRGSVRSENFNAAGLGSGAQLYKQSEDANGSNNSLGSRRLRGGGRDGRRRYSSGVRDGRPVLGRASFADEDALEDTADEDLIDDDDRSDATLQPRRGQQPPGRNKSIKSILPFSKGSMGRTNGQMGRGGSIRRREDSNDSRRRGDTLTREGSRRFQNGTRDRDMLQGPLSGSRGSLRRPPTAASPSGATGASGFEARRHKLRSWLRDTLSIREAGHAVETQNFLTIGSFTDRELRRPDLMDMEERRRIDKHRRREHERDAAEAGDDVHDLRDVRDQIWLDCVDGDGFLKMYDSLRETKDYARLPLNYQKMVSWGNLQTARWLYGVFVAGDESRANLARVQDVYESVPWKKLAFAMKMPVTQALRAWQDHFLKRGFLQAMLHVMLEDEPETIEEDLAELRRTISSEVMFQKLRIFVDSPGDLKRLIRQHAETAEVPLVAAIVRGSEQPKLNKVEVQRVMDATESYQAFMRTAPSAARKNNNKEPGYSLITNLQRALRLLSLQRDGAQVRGMLQDPLIADALTTVFEPLMEELRRLHKVKGMGNAVMGLQVFLGKLLDHLCGLRARVVDPLQAINGIAEMLDDAAPSLYTFLHKASSVTPSVFSFFAWFRHLAMTVGAGTDDLADIWTNPPPAPPAARDTEDDLQSVEPGATEDEGVLDASTMREINSLSEYARRKRNRQMEIACRWAAGDTDEHHSIQVQGDGQGKTRTEPYLPREPRPARKAPGLDRFRKSFREAISVALAG
ncbi:hypothetical protein BCV70DRAFT_185771 [Testicularia cyperi]|uniref:PX domain-containing protein n=1 Tax=Testicularia cyperi TaxID=1882483 RepID=A0A317XUK0_9BASI|nr:hypothetical protein BCV70DRAFT_185771 [Testicularia cyperi]